MNRLYCTSWVLVLQDSWVSDIGHVPNDQLKTLLADITVCLLNSYAKMIAAGIFEENGTKPTFYIFNFFFMKIGKIHWIAGYYRLTWPWPMRIID